MVDLDSRRGRPTPSVKLADSSKAAGRNRQGACLSNVNSDRSECMLRHHLTAANKQDISICPCAALCLGSSATGKTNQSKWQVLHISMPPVAATSKKQHVPKLTCTHLPSYQVSQKSHCIQKSPVLKPVYMSVSRRLSKEQRQHCIADSLVDSPAVWAGIALTICVTPAGVVFIVCFLVCSTQATIALSHARSGAILCAWLHGHT